jgi:hypothetical protein
MLNDKVHTGILKPEYLMHAKSLSQQVHLHMTQAGKAAAKASHPDAGPRKKEFIDQARSHTERAYSNVDQLNSMGVQKGETFTRRGNFHSARNAAYN